jgi:uncharacterized protein YbjT (DUF2867 family)
MNIPFREMRVAVAGGSGTVGRHVVDLLRASGHEPVVLTRASGVDLLDGTHLADALQGVEAVVDVSSTSTASAKRSTRFFETVTRNLLTAEREAGVGHHVALSVIGAEKVGASYYGGKAAQERMIMAEPGGWSLLRVAQFHELTEFLVDRYRIGPIRVVPPMRAQPIAAAEVAAELASIALGAPRGLVRDLAGPREERVSDMVRRYLLATGRPRPVLEVFVPGAWGRAMRDGMFLPAPGARQGRQSFEAWLGDVAR